MRTAPGTIDAMLGTTQLSLARCIKIVLRDGSELGFTDHDRDLTVALANDFYDPVTYRSGNGIIVGDMDLQIGLEADNTEITCPISELVTRPHVLSRRFHNADTYIFDVDWTQRDDGTLEAMEMMAGYIAQARQEEAKAIFEIRSQADRWNTTIGSLLAPKCRADFGDVKCGKTPTSYPGSVFEPLSNMRFKAALTGGPYSDDFFRYGEVEFTSGGLAGTWPYEIVAWDGYEGEVEVLSPMPEAPQAGDQLIVRNGCSRLKSSDDPTLPTCLTYQNVRRFRGFDQTPGSDRFLRFPVPGRPGI